MGNIIDKTIGFFNPQLGIKREQARILYEQFIRGYEGAKIGRRTENWKTPSKSPNAEILDSLSRLRNRMSDLVRNNPYTKRAIEIIATSTVGGGIRPSFLGEKREIKQVSKLWKDWAETTECDYDGNLNFYGLEELIMRAVAERGNAIIRIRRVTTGLIPIQLQVVEGDLLDLSKNYESGFNEYSGNKDGYTIQGVEFDKNGKKVAYWLFDRHPNEIIGGSFISKRIPASDVIHVFKIERPGQVVGVPFGVSAIIKIRDFDEYDDAQLVRQKIAACYSTFIEEGPSTLVNEIAGTKRDGNGNLIERIEPGIIQRLEPGQKIHFASPPGVEGYDGYSKGQHRAGAAGFGVTYESMTGDLSNVNFSSGRMGWLEVHKLFTSYQNNIMITMVCQKVFKVFIDACYISLLIKKKTVTADWTVPRREMIDPVKEVKGITEEIRAGLTSWSEAVRAQGYNPDELIAQIAKDYEEMNRLNLMLTSNPAFDANRSNNNTNGSDNNNNNS